MLRIQVHDQMGYLNFLDQMANHEMEVVVALPLDDPSNDLENAFQRMDSQTMQVEMANID